MELLIREATSLIYKNSYIFKILYSKHHDSSWVLFIEEHYSRILLPILEKRNNNQSTFIPVGMQAKFIIHNFIGLISIWMHQEKPELPEEYAEKIIYLFKTSAEQLIKLDNK
ncbi:TetR-like C-terminal domain-containing protein [Fructobacillus evanidus]|nr:AcrR family [Fructobacillus sp. LMG 32999]CAK1250151.1 AcrR family [Fructobacillus sp. LMG 32999]CAK1250647.1 AcrR family [Fructobacillus sp. LMG 32999]CAK1251072.1 AcrR family [Fructobacillus sp. LMG 32999]